MTTSLREICAHLDMIGWEYSVDDTDGAIRLGFKTIYYTAPNGVNSVHVKIFIKGEGKVVVFYVPALYICSDFSLHDTISRLFVLIGNHASPIYSLDFNDGEISATIQHLVEDGSLTARQILRIVTSLVASVDTYDICIQNTISQRRLIFPLDEVLRRRTELVHGDVDTASNQDIARAH